MNESGAEARVDVRGGSMTLHRRSGPGPTLLFLHYFGGSAKTWDAVINALPGRDTVAITQRGWGESARLGGPYGLHQFADDVEAILEQLDLSQVVLSAGTCRQRRQRGRRRPAVPAGAGHRRGHLRLRSPDRRSDTGRRRRTRPSRAAAYS